MGRREYRIEGLTCLLNTHRRRSGQRQTKEYSVFRETCICNLPTHYMSGRETGWSGCGTAGHQKVTSNGDDGRGRLGVLPNPDLARQRGTGYPKWAMFPNPVSFLLRKWAMSAPI